MSDFQGGDILASELSFSTLSVLDKLLHTKKINFIYPDSYNEKLRFIAIPIRSKSQQGNVTPGYIWSRTRSSWDQTSNSLTWKISFPT